MLGLETWTCRCGKTYGSQDELDNCHHELRRSDTELLDKLEEVLKSSKWDDQLPEFRPQWPSAEYRSKHIGDTDCLDEHTWTIRAALNYYLDARKM
jgi:hypothetical protein